MSTKSEELTSLLQAFALGDQSVIEKIFPIIYEELKSMASKRLKNEDAGHTLSTTDLVHEAYLKLINQKNKSWENRAHFFACAAQIMRQVLVQLARKRKAAKRGGNAPVIQIDEALVISNDNTDMILNVDYALKELEVLDKRQGRIVELRYFAGLTIEETAANLGISIATVKRDWKFAKAWLTRELQGGLNGI